MGEALIWYRRRGGVDPELLKPTTITNNGNYTAPITGTYRVYTIGAGGGGGGGCRNAWNVSQVFYGGAGTRGTLNVVNVTLNQGDNVVCTIGAGGTGGTNNTTRTSYSNGTYNSRGTNGTAGGSTSFGSYGLGAGGTYGTYSWSRSYWSNVNQGWNNIISSWVWNTTWWNNKFMANPLDFPYVEYSLLTLAINKSDANNVMNTKTWSSSREIFQSSDVKLVWQNLQMYYKNGVKVGPQRNYYASANVQYMGNAEYYNAFWHHNYQGETLDTNRWMLGQGTVAPVNDTYNFEIKKLVPVWSNKINWSNTIQNTSTRCYTSIQIGSWWYLNNNTVTTSGTRIYRSDGGNSGRAGNAGYILVIPPQS